MSEEYLAQESEEGIEEDSSDYLTEDVEYEGDWDEIVEEAIDDDVDIEDAEAFGEWLDENYEELDEDDEEDEEDEEDDEEDDEEGDEEEVPEGAAERKAARKSYKTASKDKGKMKRKAKLAKISAKKRKGKKVVKRKALKAGDEVEEDEIEEGAGAARRKAAKKAYSKLGSGEKSKKAKAAKISAKKRKGKKVKHRKKLAASTIPTTKNQMLKNIYDQVNGMLKSDLTSKYEQIMNVANLEEIEEEVAEPIRTKAAIKAEDLNIDVKDDVSALVDGEEGLTEEFKEKASTIFEAAVQAKVIEEVNKKVAEIETQNKTEQDQVSGDFLNDMTEKVDGYLTYVVEEWMKENELAIERGIRTELVEDFMSGLRTLFTEHYIDIPEEKVDMVDDLFTKVEDLEKQLDEEIDHGVDLQKELAQFKKDDALRNATKDLADTETEKISKLAEGIEYENAEQYIEKLNVLKESYFPKSDAVTSEITETDDTIEVSDEEEVQHLEESMKHYTKAIKRYNS